MAAKGAETSWAHGAQDRLACFSSTSTRSTFRLSYVGPAAVARAAGADDFSQLPGAQDWPPDVKLSAFFGAVVTMAGFAAAAAVVAATAATAGAAGTDLLEEELLAFQLPGA